MRSSQRKLISVVNKGSCSGRHGVIIDSGHATRSSAASLHWALVCEDANISTWQNTLFASLNLIISHLIISIAHPSRGAPFENCKNLQDEENIIRTEKYYNKTTTLPLC